jgi:hypothetical protein
VEGAVSYENYARYRIVKETGLFRYSVEEYVNAMGHPRQMESGWEYVSNTLSVTYWGARFALWRYKRSLRVKKTVVWEVEQ